MVRRLRSIFRNSGEVTAGFPPENARVQSERFPEEWNGVSCPKCRHGTSEPPKPRLQRFRPTKSWRRLPAELPDPWKLFPWNSSMPLADLVAPNAVIASL